MSLAALHPQHPGATLLYDVQTFTSAPQAQQVSVKGHIKEDLLNAIACISHTGVYGIEVRCCIALCN